METNTANKHCGVHAGIATKATVIL